MILHVEIIQNEWAAGQQRVVARLVFNGTGKVHLESADEDTWGPITMKPFRDPVSGEDFSPHDDPEKFIRSLHHHIRGDYLFATEAHDEGDCEYEVGAILPISSAEHEAHEVH